MNDGQWGWRALRLLAKKSPYFFTYGNNPIAKLPDYLDSMLKKMSNFTPSTTTNASASTNGTKESAKEPSTDLCTKESLSKIASNLGEEWPKLLPKLGLSQEDGEKFTKDGKTSQGSNAFLIFSVPHKTLRSDLRPLSLSPLFPAVFQQSTKAYFANIFVCKLFDMKTFVRDCRQKVILNGDLEETFLLLGFLMLFLLLLSTERAELMLTKWLEIEGEGATKEEITYILEGLKMSKALEGVFS